MLVDTSCGRSNAGGRDEAWWSVTAALGRWGISEEGESEVSGERRGMWKWAEAGEENIYGGCLGGGLILLAIAGEGVRRGRARAGARSDAPEIQETGARG